MQVLNLFLALLLNAFASDSLDKQKDSSMERSKLLQGFDRLRQIFCCCCPKLSGKVEPSKEARKKASESVEGKPDKEKILNGDQKTITNKNGDHKGDDFTNTE